MKIYLIFISTLLVTLSSCSVGATTPHVSKDDFRDTVAVKSKSPLPKYYVEKFTEENPHYPGDIYVFPLLKGGNPEIATKINTHIIKEVLDIEYGKEESSIFENVWQTPDDFMFKVGGLEYQVELLNDKWYSVTITGEFCGAYCEGYTSTYNFDIRTGNLIYLDTLFSTRGTSDLLKNMAEYKKQQMDSIIVVANEVLNSDTLTEESNDYYSQVLELYEDCYIDEGGLKYVRFIPSENMIRIFYGRCSAHYNMFADELWYFEKGIEIDKWKDRLSEFGKEHFKN